MRVSVSAPTACAFLRSSCCLRTSSSRTCQEFTGNNNYHSYESTSESNWERIEQYDFNSHKTDVIKLTAHSLLYLSLSSWASLSNLDFSSVFIDLHYERLWVTKNDHIVSNGKLKVYSNLVLTNKLKYIGEKRLLQKNNGKSYPSRDNTYNHAKRSVFSLLEKLFLDWCTDMFWVLVIGRPNLCKK